jgi:hypothetical protein
MTFAPLIKTLPILPMTANERERAHWRKLADEKNDWTLMIPMCERSNQWKAGDPPRIVQIVFCKTRGPESDKDNLHFRCKSILDALVRRKWLEDDNPNFCDLRVAELTRHNKAQTIICVSRGGVQEGQVAA